MRWRLNWGCLKSPVCWQSDRSSCRRSDRLVWTSESALGDTPSLSSRCTVCPRSRKSMMICLVRRVSVLPSPVWWCKRSDLASERRGQYQGSGLEELPRIEAFREVGGKLRSAETKIFYWTFLQIWFLPLSFLKDVGRPTSGHGGCDGLCVRRRFCPQPPWSGEAQLLQLDLGWSKDFSFSYNRETCWVGICASFVQISIR